MICHMDTWLGTNITFHTLANRNYASCGDSVWCNESEAYCSGCGGRLWQEPNPNCIPLDGECTNDVNGCCNPVGTVRCKGNKWYKQCQLK